MEQNSGFIISYIVDYKLRSSHRYIYIYEKEIFRFLCIFLI